MLAFESILFIMSLSKSIQLIMEDRRPKIVYVLFRDTIVYFGGILAAIIANMAGWKYGGTVCSYFLSV